MEEPDEKPPIIQNSHSSGESKSLPLIKLQCTMHASLNQIENFISVIILKGSNSLQRFLPVALQ